MSDLVEILADAVIRRGRVGGWVIPGGVSEPPAPLQALSAQVFLHQRRFRPLSRPYPDPILEPSSTFLAGGVRLVAEPQAFPQAFTALVQAGVDGSFGDAEDRCDLRLRHVVQGKESDDGTLVRGQGGDRG